MFIVHGVPVANAKQHPESDSEGFHTNLPLVSRLISVSLSHIQ